ncbi:hypothetical protein [Pseudoduganella violacea]|uniref:Uncharacterized protein n=1 Tax=Pseudoduganella violacea TaxID=1715466 RepID=A0A7W5BGE0_9BURK|nr:hypothetical protein [Pseudoduganella violacea]MBB3122493.1 hypothetical protein [Pseudoduganella violacea]
MKNIADEFAFKDSNGRWVPGFASRQAAIEAGLAQVGTQITTSRVESGCPSYFARFEVKSVLARMISGLAQGEEIGKLVGGGSAIERLKAIESAEFGFEDEAKVEVDLQIDLMNRLQAAVHTWIVENGLQFEQPKFISYMSEELHIAGPDLNIQLP